MKKVSLAIMVLSLAIMVSKPVFAEVKQGSAAGGAISIAVVDLSRALNEVAEGKKAKANLEKEFNAKKAELDKMKDEITIVRDELERKSHLLSQDALKEKRDEFQSKFMEYQQKAKDYTEQLARKESESTGLIIGKLRTVVETIAQRDGYTYVLEKSQGGVVYGPLSADITDQVIKQYK